MSRRNRLPTVWLDWTPAIARHFGLVPAGWTPPLRVKIAGGLRHATISARFRTPEGHVSTARVRLPPRDAYSAAPPANGGL